MNENVEKRFDCLLDELIRLREQEKVGRLLAPKRTEQLKERLINLFVEECGVALNPMLRDMISRGTALDLIKMYFEFGANNE